LSNALAGAVDETGLSAARFPAQLAYSMDEIVDSEREAAALPVARRSGRRP
jgi:hypothetical protein